MDSTRATASEDAAHMSDVAMARIGRAFSRVGWTGLCLQGAIMIPPLAVLIYVIVGRVGGARESFSFTEFMALLSFLILAFTTFWSFYYTRLGRRMQDPARRPTPDSVVRILWIGLWAGFLGIVVSLLSLFIEVIRLLVLFLKAPQAGVPVMRTELDSRTQWVSTMDLKSMLMELCTLSAEFLLLGLTLWLLFRFTRGTDYQNASTQPSGGESRGA